MDAAELLDDTGLSARRFPGGDMFASFSSDGRLLGLASSRRFDSDCFLRYVAVRDGSRLDGIGSSLVGRILSYYSGECEKIFLVSPPDTADFFVRFGFAKINPGKLPEDIRESKELQSVSISTSVVMGLELPRKWPMI